MLLQPEPVHLTWSSLDLRFPTLFLTLEMDLAHAVAPYDAARPRICTGPRSKPVLRRFGVQGSRFGVQGFRVKRIGFRLSLLDPVTWASSEGHTKEDGPPCHGLAADASHEGLDKCAGESVTRGVSRMHGGRASGQRCPEGTPSCKLTWELTGRCTFRTHLAKGPGTAVRLCGCAAVQLCGGHVRAAVLNPKP